MSRKIVIWIIVCITLSAAVVVTLFALSGILKDKRNSFLREFPPHPVLDIDTIDLKYNSYYIAGGTSHTVYLGNHKAPLHLLVCDIITCASQAVQFDVEGIKQQKFWSLRVQVDSPNFYLYDGAVPIIYRGAVGTWKATKYLRDSTFFQEISALSSSSMLVRSLSGSTGENILGKLTVSSPYQNFTDKILEKQLDGVFCTDGMLRIDRSGRVIYTYHYRNQFIVLDTSLNLLYRGNTIDTTTRVKITTATIESSGTKTLSSPPFMVNLRSYASGDRLFVNSNLLAKNEHKLAFESQGVIDVYSLADGKYHFSFNIYDFPDQGRLTDFAVFGNRMFVLFGTVMVVYEMLPEYFPPDQ